MNLSHFNILLKLAPDDRRASYLATLSTIMNIGAFVLSMLGPALANILAIRTVILIGDGIQLAGAILFHLDPARVLETEIRQESVPLPVFATFGARRGVGRRGYRYPATPRPLVPHADDGPRWRSGCIQPLALDLGFSARYGRLPVVRQVFTSVAAGASAVWPGWWSVALTRPRRSIWRGARASGTPGRRRRDEGCGESETRVE